MTNAKDSWVGQRVRVCDHTIKAGRDTLHGKLGTVVSKTPGGHQYSIRLDNGALVNRPPWRMVLAGPEIVAPRESPMAVLGIYDGAELRQAIRPGADDYLQHPSRRGSLRVWRDGRQERAT